MLLIRSIRSVASAFQSIKSGDSKIIIAGGQENMSLVPFKVLHLRDWKKTGGQENMSLAPHAIDGKTDQRWIMGCLMVIICITAENAAEKFPSDQRPTRSKNLL